MGSTSSPSFNLYKMLVFPAASIPNIKIRISVKPKNCAQIWLKIMPILLDSLDSFDPLGDSFDPNFCCSTVAGCDRSKLPTWVNADLIEQQSLFDLLAYLISFSNFSNDSIAVL
jgi:hypothetical protein